MAQRSFLVIASVLCLAAVVRDGSPGRAQQPSCEDLPAHVPQLSCDQLSACKQQKQKAYSKADTELAAMTAQQSCLKGLRAAFAGDPPVLPAEAVSNFAACIDNDNVPTPEETEGALEILQGLITAKREEVGSLLLDFEALKQSYEDGCA